jgi:hypothetical protein
VITVHDHLIEEAHQLLYPDREFKFIPKLTYSGRFKDYNANVVWRGKILEFKLCKKWRNVSKEIKIGLMQELMVKLFKSKKHTLYMDLYNGFVRKIHIAIPKTKSDPVLEASFHRLNERYFFGMLEQPNLSWATASTTKLGCYDFKTDEISMSTVFKKLHEKNPNLLDVVMYHEMLHKHLKYTNKNGKSCYHSAEFKKKEREFENFDRVDGELTSELRKVRIKKVLGF